MSSEPISELEVLRIRDEVLQAMYWMRSEGLIETPNVAELARFLAVDHLMLAPFLERFERDGYLSRTPAGTWESTPAGEEAGKRSFADEFADLTRPTHGECDEDCWCHSSPEEAAKCLEVRAHAH